MPKADAAQVPIVAMTANAFAKDVQPAKTAGMNEHAAKPLDVKRLCEILHRKTEYDSRCLFMPPFGAWERVKGKRVQIPHDLVTVIREPAARVHLHRSLSIAWEGGGRR